MGFRITNCIYCARTNTVEKSISNNLLKCVCRACRKRYDLPLIKQKKKIIYLDQNFFSHTYNGTDLPFLKRAKRLATLAQKQLLICPYSDIHDEETHSSSNPDYQKRQDELWQFIKKISRGKHFYLGTKIEEQQLINAFLSFINKGSEKGEIILSDAITPSIHDWDESLRVELTWSKADFIEPTTWEQHKKNFVDSITKELPRWRNSTFSLEENYNHEIQSYAQILLSNFIKVINSEDILQKVENRAYAAIYTLLDLNTRKESAQESLANVLAFLQSKHFSNIPYINISAGLWAIIRQEIKKNRYLDTPVEKNIKLRTQGIPADIKHLSIFVPYCDAVFTEKKMASFLQQWNQHPLGNYNFKVFSVDNWNDFDTYLDEIENNITPEMKDELEMVGYASS